MIRNYQSPCIRFLLLLILLFLTACARQSTPPGGHTVGGTLDGKAAYQLIHWPEGLRIMIWDDLALGSHHTGSSSSSSDPVFHMDGGAQGPGGEGYDYILESRDGLTGAFSIDGKDYDLDLGKLFLIRAAGGETRVEQLAVDLSGLATSNAGVEAFGRFQPEIIAFTEEVTPDPVSLAEIPAWAKDRLPLEGSTTGIELLDKVIEVILSNERIARRELVQFSTAGCVFMATLTGPPKCVDGMEEGTPADYFPVRFLPGESQPMLPEHLEPALDIDVSGLYAAYRLVPGSNLEHHTTGAEYGLIFETGDQEAWQVYAFYHITDDGHLVQLDYLGCPSPDQGMAGEPDYVKCMPEAILEKVAFDTVALPQDPGSGGDMIGESEEPMPTAPPLMTPTPTTMVAFPDLTRPLYFLTSELPTSSIIGEGHGLWVLEPGSPEVRRITPQERHVTGVDIRPADGLIAYGSQGSIFLLGGDGQARLLYAHPTSEAGERPIIGSISWSPDGEWLAFTAAYQEEAMDVTSGGLWLLEIEEDNLIQLIHNRHLTAHDDDVSNYRAIVDVDYSPDGTALLLQGSFWEYMDTLWMLPLGMDSEEKNIYNPERIWRDGAWSINGRSIVLSGWDMAAYSDLALADAETGIVTTLVDGEAAGLLISKARELPEGIVFIGAGSDPERGENHTGLYRLGLPANGQTTFHPVGPERDLCRGRYVMDIAWDPEGLLAAVSCAGSVEVVSFDGSLDLDLSQFLAPIPGENSFEVLWGN